GHRQPLVDAGVELDVHRERVLDAQRVRDRAGDEQPAAGDREHDVGPVAVVVYRLRELAGAGPELRPAHHLALVRHRASLLVAAARASTASSTSSPLESSSGEWLTPPLSERTKSIAVGTPAAASTIPSCPPPQTTPPPSGPT